MQFAENPENPYEEETHSLPTREEVLEKIRQKHKSEDARQDKIDKLLSGSPLQPPPVYSALSNLAQSSKNKTEDACELLSKFPFLTNRLLELINGPCFFTKDSFGNCRDLLDAWPLESVTHIVLALEIVDLMQFSDALAVSKNAFWTHGVVSGLAAKSIAHFLGENDIQKYFSTGLLLHLGRLVLASNMPDAVRKIFIQSNTSGVSLFDAEEKVFKFNHAQVGGNLLAQWGFDKDITDGVIHHYRPNKVKNPPQAVYIFHLSEVIAHDLKLGSSGEKYFPRPNSLAVQALGLTRSLLDNIKGEILSLVDEAKRLIIV